MNSRVGCARSWRGKNLRVEILHTRAGVAQQIWIASEESSIIVDCGDGALRDLLSADIEPGDIDALFFTHGHFDHMGGFHTLLSFLRMIGRRDPLPIFAPAGCTEGIAAVKMF